MFYRDYLILARSKPEVRPTSNGELSKKSPIINLYIAFEGITADVREDSHREE